ncbi:MAG: hypothetical protein WC916_03555 [Candidatus Woesearchaeota archaeon]
MAPPIPFRSTTIEDNITLVFDEYSPEGTEPGYKQYRLHVKDPHTASSKHSYVRNVLSKLFSRLNGSNPHKNNCFIIAEENTSEMPKSLVDKLSPETDYLDGSLPTKIFDTQILEVMHVPGEKTPKGNATINIMVSYTQKVYTGGQITVKEKTSVCKYVMPTK